MSQLSLRLTIPASPEVDACPNTHRGTQCSHEFGHALRGRPWCYRQDEGAVLVWRRVDGVVVAWPPLPERDASEDVTASPPAVEPTPLTGASTT